MKSNSFCLTENGERIVGMAALNRLFGQREYAGSEEQAGKDRCWLRYETADLKQQYRCLDKIDLKYLLEGDICAILNELFWEYEFRVQVLLGEQRVDGERFFTVLIYIAVLKGTD